MKHCYKFHPYSWREILSEEGLCLSTEWTTCYFHPSLVSLMFTISDDLSVHCAFMGG
jgi:hypothetical protein